MTKTEIRNQIRAEVLAEGIELGEFNKQLPELLIELEETLRHTRLEFLTAFHKCECLVQEISIRDKRATATSTRTASNQPRKSKAPAG